MIAKKSPLSSVGRPHAPPRSFTCSRSAVGRFGEGSPDGAGDCLSLVVYRPLAGTGLPIGIERRLGPEGERVDLLVPEIRL